MLVTDNSTAVDGIMGTYSFMLNADGALAQKGEILETSGIGPRSIATCVPALDLADVNCDRSVDGLDVASFVSALLDPAGCAAADPNGDIKRGDIDGDTFVDTGDIGGFVRCDAAGAFQGAGEAPHLRARLV